MANILKKVGNFIEDELLGGAKNKTAKKQQKKATQAATANDNTNYQRSREDQAEALALRDADQAEALRLAREDEARMVAQNRDAVGYDLLKLRADANAAGFNPLTVLQNTGAANYARDAAGIITSPFIGRPFNPRPFKDTASAVIATSQPIIETAGYVGDTIRSIAGAYIGITQEKARVAADREMADAIRAGNSASNVRGGSFPQQSRTVDARPSATVSGAPGLALPAWASDIRDRLLKTWTDRETEVTPNRDEPATTDVSTSGGARTRGLNLDIFQGEIVENLNSAWLATSLGYQHLLKIAEEENARAKEPEYMPGLSGNPVLDFSQWLFR